MCAVSRFVGDFVEDFFFVVVGDCTSMDTHSFQIELHATNCGGGHPHRLTFDVQLFPKTVRASDVYVGLQHLRLQINPVDNVHLMFEDGTDATDSALLTRIGEKPANKYKFQLLHCIKPIVVCINLDMTSRVSCTRVLLRDLDARMEEILSSAHKAFGTTDSELLTIFQLKSCILKKLNVHCGHATVKVQKVLKTGPKPFSGIITLQLSQ
jgi:hypothetical protein